jgi:hypothetical protein
MHIHNLESAHAAVSYPPLSFAALSSACGLLQVLLRLRTTLAALPSQPQSSCAPVLQLLLPPPSAPARGLSTSHISDTTGVAQQEQNGLQGQSGIAHHCRVPQAEAAYLQQVVATLAAAASSATAPSRHSNGSRSATGAAAGGGRGNSYAVTLSSGPLCPPVAAHPGVLQESRGGGPGSTLRLQEDQLAVLEASCGALQPRLQLMQGPPGTGEAGGLFPSTVACISSLPCILVFWLLIFACTLTLAR